MKKREIDLLIVVNMFLTGFDATTLNTLWVDKNLKYHGLIQAFSRTNRILNSVKTFGNIVAFRNLAKATDDAISLFGDENAESVVLLRGFRDYYDGYDDEKGQHHKGYAELIAELRAKFAVGAQVLGEAAQKDFVRIFGSILRLRNILTAFDDFAEDDPLLPPRDLQDYQSVYLDIHRLLTGQGNAEKENINDDVVFELELIRQVDINIDYILMLVEKYHATNGADKSIIGVIDRAVGSSPELRSKKELIDGFIATVNTDGLAHVRHGGEGKGTRLHRSGGESETRRDRAVRRKHVPRRPAQDHRHRHRRDPPACTPLWRRAGREEAQRH